MAMWTWSNDYNKEITKSGNNVKEEGTAGAVPFLVLKFGVFGVGVPLPYCMSPGFYDKIKSVYRHPKGRNKKGKDYGGCTKH